MEIRYSWHSDPNSEVLSEFQFVPEGNTDNSCESSKVEVREAAAWSLGVKIKWK